MHGAERTGWWVGGNACMRRGGMHALGRLGRLERMHGEMVLVQYLFRWRIVPGSISVRRGAPSLYLAVPPLTFSVGESSLVVA